MIAPKRNRHEYYNVATFLRRSQITMSGSTTVVHHDTVRLITHSLSMSIKFEEIQRKHC